VDAKRSGGLDGKALGAPLTKTFGGTSQKRESSMKLDYFIKLLGIPAAFAASFGWLIYWTGRWYKEWFFFQFQIPYEILGFDIAYYLFGSWATIAVAAAVVLIIFNFALNIWARAAWYWLGASVLLCTLAAISIVFKPFPFNPYDSFFRKLIASKDLTIIVIGFVSFVLMMASICIQRDKTISLSHNIKAFYHKIASISVILPIAFSLGLILSTWIYLATVGYNMGQYHGQSAIWEGKMGLRWVKVQGKWWILVTKASNGRNFIFDRLNNRTLCVPEAAIEEFDGLVTAAPK